MYLHMAPFFFPFHGFGRISKILCQCIRFLIHFVHCGRIFCRYRGKHRMKFTILIKIRLHALIISLLICIQHRSYHIHIRNLFFSAYGAASAAKQADRRNGSQYCYSFLHSHLYSSWINWNICPVFPGSPVESSDGFWIMINLCLYVFLFAIPLPSFLWI